MSEFWTVAVWDHPKGGVRYCVRRPSADAYDGYDYAADDLDRPWILYSLQAAISLAKWCNGGGGFGAVPKLNPKPTPERALAERMAQELDIHVDRAEAAVRTLVSEGLIELKAFVI